MKRREDLKGVERIVNDVLDDYNVRKHGIISSSSGHEMFLSLLAEAGCAVVEVGTVPNWMTCALHCGIATYSTRSTRVATAHVAQKVGTK